MAKREAGNKQNTLEEFEALLKELNLGLEKVRDRWAIMQGWDDLIFNREGSENKPSLFERGKKKGLAEIYHKKAIAYSWALSLYKILATGGIERYSLHMKWYANEISHLYPELGKRLDLQIRIPAKKELEVLEPIAEMLNKMRSSLLNLLIRMIKR